MIKISLKGVFSSLKVNALGRKEEKRKAENRFIKKKNKF
jgi:hypothetical protein